jgi:hypothetical protein
MGRQWTITGLIPLGTALVLWLSSAIPKEPHYGGKTVTQWLDAGYEDCSMALQEIGPAALPFILNRMARAEPPRITWLRWARRWNFYQKTPACNLDENRVCSLALELGPKTIPLLAQGLESRHANIRAVSARALSIWRDRGKNIQVAVPVLTRALKDANPPVRMWAARALGSQPHLTFSEVLRDSD